MALFSIKFLLFLGLLLLAYYLVPGRCQWIILLLFSIAFYYVSGGLKAGIFLSVTIVSTYLAALCMEQLNETQKQKLSREGGKLSREEKKAVKAVYGKKKKRLLTAALLFNFGILAVLKYGNFITGNVNSLLSCFSDMRILTVSFLLPLGISFYTFQTMGYLLDVYYGRAEANHDLFQFALFSSYFPQIIQGPIGKYGDLAPQLFGRHTFEPENFRRGMLRLLWGYMKKLIFADRMALIVNEVVNQFPYKGYSGFTIFVGVLFYGVQMYADFSGGIDMVLGVSEMLGIRMTENFRQPYLSRTVSEFWQRWHISLGNWMKDYLFYPIALSKSFAAMGKWMKQKFGVYYGKLLPSMLASFIVFFTVGIWHGAAWRYVCYGVYHATLTSADSLFERPAAKLRQFLHIQGESFSWKLFQMARTLVLVTFGRYFDCSDGVRMAWDMFLATFRSFNPWVFFDGSLYASVMREKEFFLLLLGMILLVIVDVLNEHGVVIRDRIAREGIVFRWLVYFSAITLILILGIYGPGYDAAAFIYQQF